MSEAEEWTETVTYQVRRHEYVWRPPGEFPIWQLMSKHATYHIYGPGFVRPDAPWVAAWIRNGRKDFEGWRETETLEDAVTNWPYRIAKMFLEAIQADPPVVHGASRYDHQGCRCDVCKAGKAAKAKASRERRKAINA